MKVFYFNLLFLIFIYLNIFIFIIIFIFKIYVFQFFKTESKRRKIIFEIFCDFIFLNGDEQGGPCLRHVRPAPPPPFSSGTTCMILGGGTIFQTLNFVRLDFFRFSFCSFFLFPFPILFGNRNFFFLLLSLLVRVVLSVNMSETRLNLLFLIVLL